MCKPFITEITREIPLKNRQTLINTTLDMRLEMEKELLEFCKHPRSLDDIKQFTKLDTTKDSIRRYLINPLIINGKLKYAQDYKSHYNQRYLNAEIEITQDMLDEINQSADILTKERIEKILEFCNEPRGIREIENYIGTKMAGKYVKNLINQGKLRYTIPSIPCHKKQRYINTSIEYETFTEYDIVEYCRTPRTKKEIATKFGLTESMRKGLIGRLIANGKICYTNESLKLGIYDGNRRLIKNG